MKTFKQFLEDAPTNNVGGGAIAGVGIGPKGEPGIRKTKYKRDNEQTGRKLMTIMKGIGCSTS